jgi:hypothetical protein
MRTGRVWRGNGFEIFLLASGGPACSSATAHEGKPLDGEVKQNLVYFLNKNI